LPFFVFTVFCIFSSDLCDEFKEIARFASDQEEYPFPRKRPVVLPAQQETVVPPPFPLLQARIEVPRKKRDVSEIRN
jgi:hypothetical protein